MGKYRDAFSLDGRVAIVTGGAGILGAECVTALADAGASVAVVDVNLDAATALAARIADEFGVATLGVACDVSDEPSVLDMVREVESTLGPIDVLHNNAASKSSSLEHFFEPLETFSLETWREVMSVNLDGLFIVARAVGTGMAERGRGSIIQTASIYGATMGPDQRIYEGSEYLGRAINTPPVYSASKGGVHALTLYLATYWGKDNVRVNTLTPGGITSGQNGVFSDKYSARVPMARMAEAYEVASGMLFLASDLSSYVSGQNLHVDGGLSAW
jgi:NAD(P)-dependent dehydrogenase (short-subunit alcohol dehydrogenase family)